MEIRTEKISEKIIKKISLAFKKHFGVEHETGASVYELNKRYSITGLTTVVLWVRQYGREEMKVKTMAIQKPEEQVRVKLICQRHPHMGTR